MNPTPLRSHDPSVKGSTQEHNIDVTNEPTRVEESVPESRPEIEAEKVTEQEHETGEVGEGDTGSAKKDVDHDKTMGEKDTQGRESEIPSA